ncbi:hypothetical protein [Caballeronia sp. BR00000012568055]|uniref:hypothetical protein n=1 Tax=Caballeronia sp. BR00000012568055 TaxID=2918761 RepID=UPI00351A6D45
MLSSDEARRRAGTASVASTDNPRLMHIKATQPGSGRLVEKHASQLELPGDRDESFAPLPHTEDVMHVLEATEERDGARIIDVDASPTQRTAQCCQTELHIVRPPGHGRIQKAHRVSKPI